MPPLGAGQNERSIIMSMLSPLLALLALSCSSTPSQEPQTPKPELDKSHVVVVQPFILGGETASDEFARIRIHEKLVDQVYAKAGIDFHFLEPRTYFNVAARDGKINLDKIMAASKADGASRGSGEILNTYFVNAVDGQAGPLGRGGFNMPILFIALGAKDDIGVEAFVMAHEAGHCLGLKHSVDDPVVPNDLVNLMGNGPFLERVGVDGLHASQVGTVQQSAMVVPRVRCLNLEQARTAMLDESFEPFFSQLQEREIQAFTQSVLPSFPLSDHRAHAKVIFRAAALGFEANEERAMLWLTAGLRQRVAPHYPLLANQPWSFLKFENDLCSGFSHTRGLSILFSQRVVDHAVALHEAGDLNAALQSMGSLLIHEQMHVLERCYPKRFAELYESVFGFVAGKVAPNSWLVENQVSNPDALSGDWLIPFQDGAAGNASSDNSSAKKTDPDNDSPVQLWLPRTILRPGPGVPRLGADFLNIAVLVEDNGDGYEVVISNTGMPEQRQLSEFAPFLDRFPIRTGKDHPNEIAAYLMEQVFLADVLGTDADQDAMPSMVQKMRDWARTGLR